MTSSHSSPLILRLQMRSRTRPLKTSAPPPGSEPSPASLSSTSISRTALPADAGEVGDLARRERLDVDVGRELLEAAHHLEVVVEGQVGMLAADDVDLGDAAGERLARLVEHLVDRERVGVGVAVVVAEGAEEAAVAADVGVVDVAVADEVDVVADGAVAHEVGHRAEREQVGRARQQVAASARRQALAAAPPCPRRAASPARRQAVDLLSSELMSLPD